MIKPQPWSPADATHAIRGLGADSRLSLSYTSHFKERLIERGLFIGDVLFVLKNGFVFEQASPANQINFYKYKIETLTPNSNNRIVRVVAIPDPTRCWMKLVTVMWVDE
jgi:Domain of unknown function (DUF4258)